MNVLFVCRSNITRSQMAQALFDRLSERRSMSAGTSVGQQNGRTLQQAAKEFEERSAPPIFALEIMQEEGLDLSNSIMSQLTRKMVDEADKVVVMAEADTLPDYLSKSDKSIFWDVPSAAWQPINEVREIKEQIKARVEELVREVG